MESHPRVPSRPIVHRRPRAVSTSLLSTPALDVEYRRTAPPKKCLSEGLEVSLAGADEAAVERLRVFARGRAAGEDRSAPFEVVASRRELRGDGPASVRTEAELLDGRRVTRVRDFSVCR